jgi:hypothetical protein
MQRHVLQTWRRVAPTTRVRGTRASRARASSFATTRASCLHSSVPTHDSHHPREWSATRESRRAVNRGSRAPRAATQARANATGIGWCRGEAERKPRSRARIEGSSGVPAHRSGCRNRQATPKAQRSATPVGRERVDGGPAHASPRGLVRVKRRRQARTRRPSRVPVEDRSRAFERTPRGKGPC